MKLSIELSEMDIRQILADYLLRTYDLKIPVERLPIQVKSKQNYRSEWEEADIRVNSLIIEPRS